MRRLDDSRLIALIRAGGDAGLEAMYLQYRDEFMGWGRRFLKADEDELTSVYTDTCIAACENVRSGKYAAAGNVKFRSYLFQIARNKHLNLQRSRKNDPLARTVEDIFGKNERGIDREEDGDAVSDSGLPDVFEEGMDSDEVRSLVDGLEKRILDEVDSRIEDSAMRRVVSIPDFEASPVVTSEDDYSSVREAERQGAIQSLLNALSN